MRPPSTLGLLLTAGLASGCAGAPPPPTNPDEPMEPMPAVEPAGAEPVEAAPEPEPEPEPPKQVTVASVEIDGGGIEESAVRTALDAVSATYEECYTKALSTTPDAKGRVFVTLLYVKGERKSVAASHAGTAAGEIMKCFTEASSALKLEPAADAERVTITVKLMLEKAEAASP